MTKREYKIIRGEMIALGVLLLAAVSLWASMRAFTMMDAPSNWQLLGGLVIIFALIVIWGSLAMKASYWVLRYPFKQKWNEKGEQDAESSGNSDSAVSGSDGPDVRVHPN